MNFGTVLSVSCILVDMSLRTWAVALVSCSGTPL